jgi:hypothetical protein
MSEMAVARFDGARMSPTLRHRHRRLAGFREADAETREA